MKQQSLYTLLFSILITCNTAIKAQNDSASTKKIEQKKPLTITPPTIGLGAGLISFYGDLRDYKYGNPFVSNPVYELYLHQPVTNYLSFNLYYMFGTVKVEERRLKRNLNFESELRVSGLSLEYNFDNFLKPKRSFSPFITAGVEMIEFNSKTDLLNGSGSKYNYWSDGTIRNLPENSPGSEFAVEIQRDYVYETDIREARFDGKGLYPERSLAIPVGIGGNVKITNQINLRIASTFHFTFTDMIDGVDRKSTERVGGDRANANYDYFLASTISLTYNFRKIDTEADYVNEVIDFYAYDPSDYDEDGVIDFMDKCPNTPPNVEVDTLGCPIDSDGDGLADYIDKEINSLGTTINSEGIYLTDEMIYESYLKYSDTSGEFADVISTNFTGSKAIPSRFRINVGAFKVGEQPRDIERLLNLPDLKTEVKDSMVVYSVGSSNELKEVVKRKAELANQGLLPTIEEVNNNQQYTSAGKRVNELKPLGIPSSEITSDSKVVFRVQLGAFKKQPDIRFFKNTTNLIVLESGGLFRYYSGAYDNFKDAAEHKVKMSVNGFDGAFVTAFKGGKKVTLESVGVKAIQQTPLIGN
ncbi:DUF6089 family protein [Vicingaceae bacterium]|nr:DUF6089 family protein [Vicingaceae bacterium]